MSEKYPKVNAKRSSIGELGERCLASGEQVAMRLWENEQPGQAVQETQRSYETVGFVIMGRAELDIEGETVRLEPGDSYVVPAGAAHHYKILEPFTAVEATSPPTDECRPRD